MDNFIPEYEYLIRGRNLMGRQRLDDKGRYTKFRPLPDNEYTRKIRKGLDMKCRENKLSEK